MTPQVSLYAAVLVGVIPVVVSQIFLTWQLFAKSRKDYEAQLSLKQIEMCGERLREFYNPLHSLLLMNGSTFHWLGPHSFPEDPILRGVAGKNWARVRDAVILENNKKIREILMTKSHLTLPPDAFSEYSRLLLHIAMYEVFQDNHTEAYDEFRFPVGIAKHVEASRDAVIEEMRKMSNGVLT